MARITICLFVALSAVAVNSAQEQGQPPVIRAGTELVRAFVTVTDRDGRLVTTLRQHDFEVRDEGKPQPIARHRQCAIHAAHGGQISVLSEEGIGTVFTVIFPLPEKTALRDL